MQEIINKIKAEIKPIMNRWEEKQFQFIKELQEYCQRGVFEEAKEKTGDRLPNAYVIHDLKVKKGWTNSIDRFFYRSSDDLKKMIAKEAEHKLLKIDVAVKKKLSKIKVEKVELLYFYPWSNDGFCQGSWKINNEKVFSFETIIAGGYNIQCLHVRTIYKLS